jgi:hypothetical protein
MADRARVLKRTCLILAGAASLCTSLLGCTGALGASWMQYPALQSFPFVLLILEAPAFALMTILSRRFIAGLWTLAVAYPLTLLLFDREMFTDASGFELYVGLGSIGPLLTAVFSQLGFQSRRVAYSNEGRRDENASNG